MQAGVSRVIIERPAKKARVTIHTARPGVVIGKKGADIEVIRKELQKMTGNEVHLNIVEIRKPEIDAALVAENIAQQLGSTRHAPAPYGAEGYVYQAYAPLPDLGGGHVVLGAWVVGDQAAGLCVREDATPITRNTSRFLPHYF